MNIRMNLIRFLSFCAVLATALMLAPSDAHAQARPRTPTQVQPATHAPVAGKVSIKVQVIHANNSGHVDPQLKSVEDHLKFTRFSGFELLQTHDAKLSTNQDQTFQVAGGRRLKVKVVGQDSRAAKIRVQMTNDAGKVMDTTVSINRNRAFMLAGPDFKDGKLVLPITVRY